MTPLFGHERQGAGLACEELAAEVERLRARVWRAEAALRKYGAHRWDCAYEIAMDSEVPCDCGFDAARAAAEDPR